MVLEVNLKAQPKTSYFLDDKSFACKEKRNNFVYSDAFLVDFFFSIKSKWVKMHSLTDGSGLDVF